MMSAPHAEPTGGTASQLLVRELVASEANGRMPALARLEESLGGQMTQRLLCALAGDHRMRAPGLLLDRSSSP
jgi:hypothetical protein